MSQGARFEYLGTANLEVIEEAARCELSSRLLFRENVLVEDRVA